MSENNCASITWSINNFSYCWQKNGEAIVSPVFSIYMPEETRWKLHLFPRGISHPDRIAFFLYRDKDCNGAENIKVEYSLDIQNNTASFTDCSQKNEFGKDMRNGFSWYISRYQVLKTEANTYLPQDILTVRCRLMKFDDKPVEMRQIFARTIIGAEKHFFQVSLENFSKLAKNQIQSFVIKSESEDVIMKIYLALTSERKENISFGIESFDQCMNFSAVKVFICSPKQEVDSGEYEYWLSCGKFSMLPLRLTKNFLIENKSLHIPKDVLTLRFEFAISNGFAFEGIEKTACENNSHPFPNKVTEDWRKCIIHKSIYDCSCALIADLTSLHKDESSCDMKLQTKTLNFPVHTLILGARSPVFRAMFANDMKEKLNKCVDVSDLQDETVRRFVLYLYSGQLQDLKWDDALQLYKAADKYAVISLRGKCSMFLKSNLNPENVCEALVLSDLHQDKDLKEIVEIFILKNAKVIFKSEKWKLLAENNFKLAYETMLRNWNEE